MVSPRTHTQRTDVSGTPLSYEAGKIWVSGHMSAVNDAVITTNASAGNYEIVAASSGQAVRVLDYTLLTPGSVEAFFRSSAGGAALTGGMNLARGVAPGFNPMGYFQTETSHALTIQVGAAVSVGGHLTWIGV